MTLPDTEATNVQSHERANVHGRILEREEGSVLTFLDKRHAVQSDNSERPHKIRRLSDLRQVSPASPVEDLASQIPPSKLHC